MAIRTENPEQIRLIAAIIGGFVFFLFNILFPYMKMLFPYLERRNGGTWKFWAP